MEVVPYMHKHVARKVSLWLIAFHEKRGTCFIDFNRMSAEDLQTIVPDQSTHIDQLQHTDPGCSSQAAGQTNQRPMLLTCGLCSMKKLMDSRYQRLLQLLMHPDNLDALSRKLHEYTAEFGMPPSYYRLAQLCEGQQGNAQGMRKIASPGCPGKRI